MANTKIEEYIPILEYLCQNKDKLQIFLSADNKFVDCRFRIKGKKSSRTIFMSEKLQFLMNEFCIENELKIGEFVELAVIEQLCRSGFEAKLKAILQSSDEGKQGKTLKEQVGTRENTGEQSGD